MTELLFSTTLLAAFLGGVLALAAPCCVSVMLPAYFASTFRHRRSILGMTMVFAAGLATVILPIALGATALSRLFISQHVWVYSIGGAAMIAFGAAMLLGWKMKMPMPGLRATSGGGIGATYLLGAFSGIASACCAPVLAGVVAVSGAVASFPAALSVGAAYVFGMVAPLTILALVWDRRDWGSATWLNERGLRLRGRKIPLWSLLSGGLMVAMGILTVILALTERGMTPDGWQARVAAQLRFAAAHVQHALGSTVPGIVISIAILGSLAWLLFKAIRGTRSKTDTPETEPSPTDLHACCEDTPATQKPEKTEQP
ncbi:cytochrome c biogenesis CcdA family protein [Glycomyces halotolerans]